MTGGLDQSERRTLRRKAREATLNALRALGGEARREAIREWALAHGDFTAHELDAPPPDAASAKYRRAVDHQLAWTLTNLKREGLVENPKWGTWKLTDAALPVSETVVEPVDGGRLAELRAMPYQRYLRTPEWRRTRAAALLRAGYACSLDVSHTEELEVHHRSYARLGAEIATDLVVLCHPCHQLHHSEYGLPRREQRVISPATPGRSPAGSIMDAGKKRTRSLLRRLLAD